MRTKKKHFRKIIFPVANWFERIDYKSEKISFKYYFLATICICKISLLYISHKFSNFCLDIFYWPKKTKTCSIFNFVHSLQTLDELDAASMRVPGKSVKISWMMLSRVGIQVRAIHELRITIFAQIQTHPHPRNAKSILLADAKSTPWLILRPTFLGLPR